MSEEQRRDAASGEGAPETPGFGGDEATEAGDVLQDQKENCDNSNKGITSKKTFYGRKATFPEVAETTQLSYYERYKAYQDYILGDTKPSEVHDFIAEYLEKVLEPYGWQAIWSNEMFEVLVEVTNVETSSFRAAVKLREPFLYESEMYSLNMETIESFLEAKNHLVPLQELYVIFDESGEFDQTALAIEHFRFFFQHIWRIWDEDDEDDDFDYFVRCCEPRLKLEPSEFKDSVGTKHSNHHPMNQVPNPSGFACRRYYDILEDRVPADLIAEYNQLMSKCEETYKEFTKVRNNISANEPESELNNVSMVEGVKLCEELDKLKYKLQIMESPLYRYVLRQDGYGLPGKQAKGVRSSGEKVIHVVSTSMTINLMQSLLKEKLNPDYVFQDQVMEFHSDPLAAINACYEGDVVIICPGRYGINGYFRVADSIQVEGYGLPDDIVLVKEGKGDIFVDCTASCVKISNLKFIQHDAVEGIICVRKGKVILESCVLQCDSTGVVLRTSAELHMKNCDLYGAKGAGIEIYPSSTCELFGNDIHHCKEGILIKNFMEQLYDVPDITIMNNLVHNHQDYGFTLSKFAINFKKNKPFFALKLTSDVEQNKLQSDFNEKSMELTSSCCVAQQIPGLLVEECVPAPSEEIVVLSPLDTTVCDEAITNELICTSATKREQSKSRLNETVHCGMNNLMPQEIFPSIVGNHFKKNGKGSFGIVYC